MHRDDSRILFLALSLLLLPLQPGAALADASRMTGRVLDAGTLTPIAGAEVELANMNAGQGFFRTHSDRAGTFTIEGIAANRYYVLTVSAPGYADFILNSWQFPDAQRAVEVAIPLDRAGTLEVRATRANGRTAVPNARVAIVSERAARWWEGARPAPAPVFTDAKGVARFVDIQAGNWAVTVDLPGFLTAESRQVAVRRGETTSVPASLVKPGTLSGTVQLADGSGVPNVTITARGPAEGVGTSGPEGEFTIEGLPRGRYRLDLSQEGFARYRSRETYTLEEGTSRGGISITVTPNPPEFAIVMDREAFVPGTEMRVGLRSFRVSTLGLTLFSIPTSRLLNPERDFRQLADLPDTAGLPLVKRFNHAPAEGPPYAWREEQVLLPTDIAPGAYLLRARGAGLERRTIFFVTDLGILVKRSPTRALVSAASLKTGDPVAGASVYVTDAESGDRGGPHWPAGVRAAASRPHATTDPRGLADIQGTGTSGARFVAVSVDHGVSVAESPVSGSARQGGDRVYLYTERPIYRPGQTVYWKLFARTEHGQGYGMPTDGHASVAMIGPGGSSFAIASTRISPSGTSDSSFVLPADAALGDWRVSGTVGRATSGATFAVQEYRKPEFKVDVTPDREVYVNGDEVRFVVASSYFFGSPVFGATVRYNLFESRLDGQVSLGEANGDGDEEVESPRPGYGRVLMTGEARTDVDGRVAIEFTPPRVTYDRRVSLEVEVLDASNRAVNARGSAIVGRGLFTIQIRPSTALVLAGQAIGIEVRTADHLGKPVTAVVQVDLDQDAWSPLEHRYVRSTRPLASATVTTDATGKGSLSLLPSPARSGYIKILARAEDVKGNRVADESSVWVYDAGVRQYAYRYPNLETFLDRDHYAAGDTARILVNTDARNAQVLATVEGKEIEAVQVVTLVGNTGLVSVPVRAEYAPNVFVSVSVRRGAEVRSRTLELSVAGPKHDLAIRLETDRSEYRPGEEAHIRVETHDGAGHPEPAEVSVGVVDEAIYSLRADDTADPNDVFYGKRPNWITTSVSFPLLYYAGVDKGREREVRKDFRDVALWAPVVRTDAQGRADVTLHWPDNLTTWRITSRGMSDATLVGKAVAKTLVSKPIVARMALPRMFIAGDESALLSVVNNRSKTPVLGMRESIHAEGYATITGETSRAKDLPASGESRSAWPVRIARDIEGDSAQARFTFRAVGKDDADALELSASVLPRAVPLGSRGAGMLDRASTGVTVTLPSDLVASGSWVAIECSPSPAAMAVTAANYLASYPYSCTEQTANAILAGAALRAVGMRLGNDAPGWGDAGKKLAPFVDHLVALQSPDGGWAWWAGGERDPYLTALALEALARADAAGVGTPAAAGAMWQGARVAPRLLAEERSLDGQCYMLARLAPIYARTDVEQMATGFREEISMIAYSIYARRDRLGTAALALAARAHAEMGRMTEANVLVALVKKQAVSSAGETYWPGSPDSYAWFGEDVENTGYALAAILSVAPTDPLGPSTVRWLAGRRHGGYWRSTRSTAPVVTALAQYLLGHAAELKSQYRLRVQWNGETVMDRAVTPADAYGSGGFSVRLPGSRLKKGENRLAISRDGSGAVYFAWEARAMVPSPGPSTAAEKRLIVRREFFRAELTADRRGRPRYLATPIAAGEEVRIGEPVMVRLTLEADRDLRWIMIEDPRPSGFEVSDLLPQGTEWPWGTHAEQRDDRNLFFLDQLEKGETVIEYIDRPEMSGAFTALPTNVSSMYMPELTARSGEDKLIVGEK